MDTGEPASASCEFRGRTYDSIVWREELAEDGHKVRFALLNGLGEVVASPQDLNNEPVVAGGPPLAYVRYNFTEPLAYSILPQQ